MSDNNFRKPFDKELFKANDKRAREAVKAYFKTQDILLMDNIFNEFAVDLLEVEQGKDTTINVVGTWECEVRNSWKSGPFPFATMRLPMRKMKFKGSHFCVLNDDESYIMHISPELLESSDIESIVNKMSAGRIEDFISIDVSKCDMICLKPKARHPLLDTPDEI